jgi:hypothetical protein
MSVRGRWVVDKDGELVEDRVPDHKPAPVETEAERKKREQAERDEHPGLYL